MLGGVSLWELIPSARPWNLYFLNQKPLMGPLDFLWVFPPSPPPQMIGQASVATAHFLLASGRTGSDCPSKRSLGQKYPQLDLPELCASLRQHCPSSQSSWCFGDFVYCLELFDPIHPSEFLARDLLDSWVP